MGASASGMGGMSSPGTPRMAGAGGALGPDGWLTRGNLGALEWARGKHKGHRVTRDPGYAKWCASLPRLPSGIDGESWCSAETAALLGA